MRMVIGCWVLMLAGLAGQERPAAPTPLDYEFFKTRVQPIFVAKRPGHARCVACHVTGTPLRLQPLSPGTSTWSEEESRKNFEAFRRVASDGPKSRLLIHPLAEQAGGDFYHSGGKHWKTQGDAEWQTLQAWVLGQTAQASATSK